MKKISRICFITLVFMSATLPSSGAPAICILPCGQGYYLDPVECECKDCPEKFYCPDGKSKIACPGGATSPSGSDSEDDCVFDCTKISNNEGECKGTGFCGYYYDRFVFEDDPCKNCNDISNKNDCGKYAGCYWDQVQGKCTHCQRGYYCESGNPSNIVCSKGQTSQQASYSKDDCYFDCELYNEYKNIDDLGVNYAKDMCKAAPGCYWNEDKNSCEYCPNGYYCDNTEDNGLQKQKCPLNSTSDPKSTNKLDCYLGSINKICDSNNVCYKLDNDEKIYYWQTNAEFMESGIRIPAQFPTKENCYLQDPLPCI